MDRFCLHISQKGFPLLLAEEACLQWQAFVAVPSPQGPTRRARRGSSVQNCWYMHLKLVVTIFFGEVCTKLTQPFPNPFAAFKARSGLNRNSPGTKTCQNPKKGVVCCYALVSHVEFPELFFFGLLFYEFGSIRPS